MSIRYYVGERPSRPLVVTLVDADGQPYDLSGYETVGLEGDLPDGEVFVIDAAAGRIKYEFYAPFAEAGVLDLRAVLTNADGKVDYGGGMLVTVANELPGSVLYAGTDEVERVTGTPVSANQVARAQAMVGLALDRDLSDPLATARFSARDAGLVRQAVAWQAEGLANGTVNELIPSGAATVSNGDVSIGFGNRGNGATPWLAPLASMAVRRVSWLGSKTHHLNRARASRTSALVSDAHAWLPIS